MENHLVSSCKQVSIADKSTGEMKAQFIVNTTKGASIWSETPIKGGQVIQLVAKKAGDKYKDSKGEEKVVTKDGYLFQGEIGGTTELIAIQTNKELLAKIEL